MKLWEMLGKSGVEAENEGFICRWLKDDWIGLCGNVLLDTFGSGLVRKRGLGW